MMINSDLIKIAEASPDTMLTLIHGEKLIVRESCEEIAARVLAYRARLLAAMARELHEAEPLLRVSGMISQDAASRVTTGAGVAMTEEPA